MPPVRTTNVMPMARIAEIATCLVRMARLLVVRNEGANEEKRITSAISTNQARARRANRIARADVRAARLAGRRGRLADVIRVELRRSEWTGQLQPGLPRRTRIHR